VNLITKYGIVPKEVFPESHSATASARMNYILTNKLRQFASELRELWASGADTATLRDAKLGMMEVVHSIVLIHLGTPPAGTFDWSYTDKESKFHCLRGLTPQRFLAEVVQVNVTTKISLIHDPRNPFYAKYTVHKLNNMVGGLPVTYINLPIEELQRYAAQTLEAGEPVWFGCDCGKFMQRGAGLFDTEAFDYELVYGVGPGMDKRTRLHMGESLMTHAMVFTGYDKRPVRGQADTYQ
jgi:bleomycin hydrolase